MAVEYGYFFCVYQKFLGERMGERNQKKNNSMHASLDGDGGRQASDQKRIPHVSNTLYTLYLYNSFFLFYSIVFVLLYCLQYGLGGHLVVTFTHL